MNLVNHLAERAQRHPDRLALIDADQSMSYADLYRHVCGASQLLRGDGLGEGDTVLILQPVGIPLYISLLGAFHAGLTVMFIDPSAGKAMMRNSLSLHQPSAFIGVGKAHLLRLTTPEIRRISHPYHSSGWVPLSRKWSPQAVDVFDPVDSTADAPALITFTSGSTGMPKAACRSHGFLLAQHQALAESLHYQEGQVDLVTLPVFTLANLASGLTSVLADTDLRFPALANSTAVAAQCNRHKVTRCAASPAFFAKLFRDQQLPEFTSIYTGGAPVFPDLLDRIQAARPEMDVVTVFGSTEAEPIAHIAWKEVSESDHQKMLAGQGLLVGKPVQATQLRIVTDQSGQSNTVDFDAQELPVGAIGEILVTGDHVLKGYLHGKGNEESKVSIDGEIWHRTGDAAWQDETGRVWLVGRCGAAIARDGQPPLYPFGIECAAMSHPSVQRCALLKHRDQITLFYEGQLSEDDRSELFDTLSLLGVEAIENMDHIPVDKRHNAKIDYPALRATIKDR
ncbi:AMP-binding protein [Verrucomicrobiaceae bacterium R5-34]|nr:AMP-binding protein [Verrucomicrobiaceae bacterium R5-34]